MRTVRSIVILLAVSVLGACSDDTPVTVETDRELANAVEVGEAFRLAVGDRARIGDDGLGVGFRGVRQDSRCPTDVECVWAGDAAVALTVAVGRAAPRTVTLHTHQAPRATRAEGLVLRVVSLAPEPVSTRRIAPDDYVVTLIAERPR